LENGERFSGQCVTPSAVDELSQKQVVTMPQTESTVRTAAPISGWHWKPAAEQAQRKVDRVKSIHRANSYQAFLLN
jgi:hypothetical protein